MEQQAPAGWYTDAQGNQRYWTGSQWSDPAHPVAYGAPPAASAPMPPAPPTPVYVAQFAAPPGQQVAPKNAAVAVLCSFFLPGLGQFVNGDGGKGVAMLIGYFVSWALVFVFIGIPMVFGVWVWSMVDAYTYASAWNRRHGIIA